MAARTESGLKVSSTRIPDSTETESALDDPYDHITGDIVHNMFGAYSAIPAILDPRFVVGEPVNDAHRFDRDTEGITCDVLLCT